MVNISLWFHIFCIYFHMVVKVKELQELIIAMPVGKASGYNHISNEHFKYANEKLHILMSLFCSSLLIHVFFT